MNEIIIRGGKPLEGTLRVQGAKNSVLPILAATVLHPGRSLIRGCPRLSDVEASVRILRHLGCEAQRLGYFCLDNKDSKPGHLVFNRSVGLKDSFKK